MVVLNSWARLFYVHSVSLHPSVSIGSGKPDKMLGGGLLFTSNGLVSSRERTILLVVLLKLEGLRVTSKTRSN